LIALFIAPSATAGLPLIPASIATWTSTHRCADVGTAGNCCGMRNTIGVDNLIDPPQPYVAEKLNLKIIKRLNTMSPKLSTIMVCIYLFFTMSIVIYSRTCSGEFCGFASLIPIMPWPILLDARLGFGSILIYIGLVGVNSTILYFLATLISILCRKKS
jgi:hypothetical protein